MHFACTVLTPSELPDLPISRIEVDKFIMWLKLMLCMHVTRFLWLDLCYITPAPLVSLASFLYVGELKKPRQLQREQRRLKNDFIFYASRDTLKSFTLFIFITVKTIAKLKPEHGDKIEIKQ